MYRRFKRHFTAIKGEPPASSDLAATNYWIDYAADALRAFRTLTPRDTEQFVADLAADADVPQKRRDDVIIWCAKHVVEQEFRDRTGSAEAPSGSPGASTEPRHRPE